MNILSLITDKSKATKKKYLRTTDSLHNSKILGNYFNRIKAFKDFMEKSKIARGGESEVAKFVLPLISHLIMTYILILPNAS